MAEKVFCTVAESPSGAQVSINAQQVRYVRAGAHGTCVIYFDENDSISVEGTLATITALLRLAVEESRRTI